MDNFIMKVSCLAPNCEMRTYNLSKEQIKLVQNDYIVSFHKFPLNHEQKSTWAKAANIPIEKVENDSSFCSLHFGDECFNDENQLLDHAIPTIFYTNFRNHLKNIAFHGNLALNFDSDDENDESCPGPQMINGSDNDVHNENVDDDFDEYEIDVCEEVVVEEVDDSEISDAKSEEINAIQDNDKSSTYLTIEDGDEEPCDKEGDGPKFEESTFVTKVDRLVAANVPNERKATDTKLQNVNHLLSMLKVGDFDCPLIQPASRDLICQLLNIVQMALQKNTSRTDTIASNIYIITTRRDKTNNKPVIIGDTPKIIAWTNAAIKSIKAGTFNNTDDVSIICGSPAIFLLENVLLNNDDKDMNSVYVVTAENLISSLKKLENVSSSPFGDSRTEDAGEPTIQKYKLKPVSAVLTNTTSTTRVTNAPTATLPLKTPSSSWTRQPGTSRQSVTHFKSSSPGSPGPKTQVDVPNTNPLCRSNVRITAAQNVQAESPIMSNSKPVINVKSESSLQQLKSAAKLVKTVDARGNSVLSKATRVQYTALPHQNDVLRTVALTQSNLISSQQKAVPVNARHMIPVLPKPVAVIPNEVTSTQWRPVTSTPYHKLVTCKPGNGTSCSVTPQTVAISPVTQKSSSVIPRTVAVNPSNVISTQRRLASDSLTPQQSFVTRSTETLRLNNEVSVKPIRSIGSLEIRTYNRESISSPPVYDIVGSPPSSPKQAIESYVSKAAAQKRVGAESEHSEPQILDPMVHVANQRKNIALLENKIVNKEREVCALRKKVQALKKRYSGVKNPRDTKSDEQLVEEILSKYLESDAVQFFVGQMKVSGKTYTQFRWSEEDKLFALGLLYRHPAEYHIMFQKFTLPSDKTLSKFVAKIKKAEHDAT